MAIEYVNPYSFIGSKYSDGLDAIIVTLNPLAPNPTLDDLVEAVYNYATDTYMATPPDALEAQSLKLWITNSINGYLNVQNGEYLLYNEAQMGFVHQLTQGTIDIKNPEDIKQYILDIEDKITASKLTSAEQMPLLYATAIGTAAYSYWSAAIAVPSLPMPSPWAVYMNSFTPSINKFPFWVSASMEGTLIALKIYSSQIQAKFTDDIEAFLMAKGGYILLALFGALGVGAGKVVFKWQQRSIG